MATNFRPCPLLLLSMALFLLMALSVPSFAQEQKILPAQLLTSGLIISHHICRV